VRARGDRLAKLVGGPVRVALGDAVRTRDGHAAIAELRVGGASFELSGSSGAVRALAQQLLGGPKELAAPRPLSDAEQAVFALVVATALEDAGIAGEVWPLPPAGSAATIAGRGVADRKVRLAGPRSTAEGGAELDQTLQLDVQLGDLAMTVGLTLPRDLELRAPPPRALPRWSDAAVEALIVVARCALPRTDVAGLSVRDIVTVERMLELDVLGGAIGLSAAPHAVEATVATGYVRRDMALPDDAHLELTVALGTQALPLRQIVELAIGSVIPLGRPLAGPFELRALGRVIGMGELVDLEGELGVRVVSLVE
jgi:flagellar motor switch/type III secretory pathway protein FliN